MSPPRNQARKFSVFEQIITCIRGYHVRSPNLPVRLSLFVQGPFTIILAHPISRSPYISFALMYLQYIVYINIYYLFYIQYFTTWCFLSNVATVFFFCCLPCAIYVALLPHSIILSPYNSRF